MKHKTWFRLVIKAIGVLLVGQALPGLVRAGIEGLMQYQWLQQQMAAGGLAGSPFGFILSTPVSLVLEDATGIALGLYLFFGGRWIVNLAIPSNRPYCPECGYDLSRNDQAKCPECGVGLPARAPTL